MEKDKSVEGIEFIEEFKEERDQTTRNIHFGSLAAMKNGELKAFSEKLADEIIVLVGLAFGRGEECGEIKASRHYIPIGLVGVLLGIVIGIIAF